MLDFCVAGSRCREYMHALHHYDVHKLCIFFPGSDKWEVSQFLLNWKLWTRDKCIYRHQAVFEWAAGDNAIRRKTSYFWWFNRNPKATHRLDVGVSENGGFPPQIIPCRNRVFHHFHHPFWGKISIFLETPTIFQNPGRKLHGISSHRGPRKQLRLSLPEAPVISLPLATRTHGWFFTGRVKKNMLLLYLFIACVLDCIRVCF